MRARLPIAAVTGLSLAAAVSAEPPKAPAPKTEQPAEQAPAVVVAAADQVRPAAATEEQSAAPAKRVRKARVTTCRCGDQTPND